MNNDELDIIKKYLDIGINFYFNDTLRRYHYIVYSKKLHKTIFEIYFYKEKYISEPKEEVNQKILELFEEACKDHNFLRKYNDYKKYIYKK